MLPEKTFDGRVAVITGGGTGIGFGIARELARLGATLVLCSRSEEHLGPAVEQLRSETGRAGAGHFHVLDVRDADAVEAMAEKVAADHGRIDLLVNNAAGNFMVESAQLSVNGWNSVIGIVLNGTFYCTSAVGKRMIAAKSGAILNVIANYAWTGAGAGPPRGGIRASFARPVDRGGGRAASSASALREPRRSRERGRVSPLRL